MVLSWGDLAGFLDALDEEVVEGDDAAEGAGGLGVFHFGGGAVDDDEVGDEVEGVGVGDLGGALGVADGVDEFEVDLVPGVPGVVFEEGLDAGVVGGVLAEGAGDFHGVLAPGEGGGLQEVEGALGEGEVGVAGEVDAPVVVRGEVVHGEEDDRGGDDLEEDEEADVRAPDRAELRGGGVFLFLGGHGGRGSFSEKAGIFNSANSNSSAPASLA